MSSSTFDSPPPTTRPRSWQAIVFGLPGRLALLMLVVVGCVVGYRIATDRSPRESDRVTHPGGYSMICPRDWESLVETRRNGATIDLLSFRPLQWRGLPPSIWVKRVAAAEGTTPYTEKYTRADFQNEPAWVLETNSKRYLTRKMYFKRGGQWFEIGTTLADAESVNMAEWWKFAESFRLSGAQMQ